MKTVSATEAKNRLAALIGEVVAGHGEVVIENHGQPRAVLISYEQYQELLEAREEERRRQALEGLRQLRAMVRARNHDLDEAKAEEIAEQISREAITNIINQAEEHDEERAS